MSEQKVAYNALNFDGLERRGNYRFIGFREDMLHALDKNKNAALLYNAIERWQVEVKRPAVLKEIEARKTHGKTPLTEEEVEDMMFVYMSYNQFVHESGGAVSYNTVIRLIDYLVNEEKVLIQRPSSNPDFSDFEYSINKERARTLLKSLPADPAFKPKVPKKKTNSTQIGIPSDGSTQTDMDSTHMGTPSTQTGTEVYPNGGTSQELTSFPQEHTGDTSFVAAHADDTAKDEKISSLEQQLAAMQAQLEAVQHSLEEISKRVPIAEGIQENGAHSHSPMATGNTGCLMNEQTSLRVESEQEQPSSTTEEHDGSNENIPHYAAPVLGNGESKQAESEVGNGIVGTAGAPGDNYTRGDTGHADVDRTERGHVGGVPSGKGEGEKSSGSKRKTDPLNDRVKAFYDNFEALGSEYFADPAFKCNREYGKKNPLYKSIVSLLNEGAGPDSSRMAFAFLWNKQIGGEYVWRDPSTLTIWSFCKHYRSSVSSAKFNARQQAQHFQKNSSGRRNFTWERIEQERTEKESREKGELPPTEETPTCSGKLPEPPADNPYLFMTPKQRRAANIRKQIAKKDQAVAQVALA